MPKRAAFGLGACYHLRLLNHMAPVRMEVRKAESILEDAAIPHTKIQADPVATRIKISLKDLEILFVTRTRLQSTEMHTSLQHQAEFHCPIIKWSKMNSLVS